MKYHGAEHLGTWEYYTIDARYKGMPASSGITIQDNPTRVCGHDGDWEMMPGKVYCGDQETSEWRDVWACGDPTPTRVTLSVNPDTVKEDGGSTEITVTGKLDHGAFTSATSITVSVDDGTAVAGTDFRTVNDFMLTFLAEETSATARFNLVPTNDDLDEDDETLTVDGSRAGLAFDPATITITDNDTAGVTVTPTALTVTEGSSESYTVELDSQPTGNVTVTVGGASGDVSVDKTELTFTTGNWDSAQTVRVSADEDDDTVEDPQVTLTHTVSGGGYGGVNASNVTVNVTEDDAEQRVKLSMGGDSEWVMEGDPPSQITVKALLTGDSRNVETHVAVHLDPNQATLGLDFEPVPLEFPIVIPENAQSASHTFTFTPKVDEVEEGAETLIFTGTSDRPVDPTTMMIKDNDRGGGSDDDNDDGDNDDGDGNDSNNDDDDDGDGDDGDGDDGDGDDGDGDDGDGDDGTMATANDDGDQGDDGDGDDDDDDGDDDDGDDDGDSNDGDSDGDDDGNQGGGDGDGDDGDGDDGDTGAASGPPEFLSARYAFDLPEHRDGRKTPVRLGVVTARDPDGEALTYALATGDGSRFQVDASSGTIAYIGVGEDYEAGPRQYELTVSARDRDRLTADAVVIVAVTDVPEGPAATADSAQTREDEPAVIDVLANDSDAGGNRLRVAALTAPEHGTASVVSGGVRYAPSANYHGQDRFSYTVADAGGLTDTAMVTVKVMPVNDSPEAADDEAETLEDEPVVVDVLGNDTDVDGDRLVVVAATLPGHGTATVVAGGVRYAPSFHYHGPDRFRYTIRDPAGSMATAMVTLTVLPINDAPEAVGVMPDQNLEEGGEASTVDLVPYFTDADGDPLTYTAESSDPAATVVAVNGSVLTLTAVVTGVATVTVTATDTLGLQATQVFGVAVGDRLVREVLTDTLAALGRGHLSSVRQTVGRRLETAGADTSRLTLVGQYFSPTMWNRLGTGSLAQTHEWYFRAAMLQQRQETTAILGTSADPRLRESGFLGFGGLGGFGNGWDQALLGTDMLLAFGGDDQDAGESGGRGPRWTVWGQGDLQMFRGSPTAVKGYEGDLRTGYLGVDAQLTRHWLLGVAMARSGGAGTWERGASAGALSTTLTRVHPYVRWAKGDTAIWGVLGLGRGTATHVRTLTGLREASPLGLGLGLLEGRRRVATLGSGLEIGVRGEASWAHLATAGGGETIDDLEAGRATHAKRCRGDAGIVGTARADVYPVRCGQHAPRRRCGLDRGRTGSGRRDAGAGRPPAVGSAGPPVGVALGDGL